MVMQTSEVETSIVAIEAIEPVDSDFPDEYRRHSYTLHGVVV
jgi:hypothetical protein